MQCGEPMRVPHVVLQGLQQREEGRMLAVQTVKGDRQMDEPTDRLGAAWPALIEDVITGMEDWRTAHPTATFAEIEAEVETRLGQLRVRMLEDAVLASAARSGTTPGSGERHACPNC